MRSRIMPRPRTFDPDAALEAALDVFHAKGYEATSVQDLVDATGLSRSSLYAAFGDKHGLYLAALDRYAEAGRRALSDLCGCASPAAALRTFFEHVAEAGPEGGLPPRGCLLTNAAAECASRDPDTARRAAAARQGMTDAFERVVRDAQAAGEVAPDRDARALARFLAGAVFGLRGLAKAGAAPDELADVVETTLAAVIRG